MLHSVSRRIRNSIAFIVLAVTAWMAYDNVLSDDAPIRALAEKTACAKKKCEDQHGVTREQRAPWGQSIDYTWRDGTVKVECHRSYYVFGERVCAAE